jgi:hypothetical protein
VDTFKLTTPLAFFIFNRPDTTTRVFEQIRQAKPVKLLVVADGPRATHPDDEGKCAAARAVVEQVDWDCEVMKNYADTNLGCKTRMSSGLDWVFDTVAEAIILEHDTLPTSTFFRFCQELLEKYRDDQRIMMISGCNFQFGNRRTEDSYYFSRYVHCWGWAGWRRAWQSYDVNMALWPMIRDGGWLNDILDTDTGTEYWNRFFDATYLGYIDTWDYQWVFACWAQNGLSIMPNVNLVANIGFGSEATHTGNTASNVANLPVTAIDFPLEHPAFIVRDAFADKFTQELYNCGDM